VVASARFWTARRLKTGNRERIRRNGPEEAVDTPKTLALSLGLPDEVEKQAIVAACEAFIDNVLKPRFLPEIRPTQWNYVIDINGTWAAGRYRFVQRYRSGMEHNFGEEFDAPFARIDRIGSDRFDIYWMRHTGKWWRRRAACRSASNPRNRRRPASGLTRPLDATPVFTLDLPRRPPP